MTGHERTAMITGGAGFIGSHLADKLLARGWRVVAFDNLAIGRLSNVAHLTGRREFTLVQGDIADAQTLRKLVAEFQVEAIFHLAAVHYIPFCDAQPFEAIRVNVLGTQAVIDAVAAGPVCRIVFASTSDVYAVKETAHAETDALDPYTVYGNTKLFAERLLSVGTRAHPGLSVSVARLFNVYGPRETNPHVLPDILDQLKVPGVDTLRLGNVWPRRDFIFVEDVADGLVALLDSASTYDVFNLGNGKALAISEVVGILGDLLGRPLRVTTDPAQVRPVERACLEADIHKAVRVLGWKPAWSFPDGLRHWLAHEAIPS
jgi:UDP-glucose 4-epimerase